MYIVIIETGKKLVSYKIMACSKMDALESAWDNDPDAYKITVMKA